MNKKILFSIAFFFTFALVNAANRYSVTSGLWGATSTWSATSGGASGASVPVAGDVVFIEGGFNVTLNINAVCASLSFTTATATSLTLGSFQLDVSGAITIPMSGTGVNLIAVGAGNLNAGSIAFTNGGAATAVRHQITISTGTVTVAGNLTQTGSTGSASITFTDAGSLRLGGTFLTSTTGTLTTVAGSTVEYNGAAQTVGAFTYNNLTLSGSGVKTAAGNLTVNGTLSTIAGSTLNMGTNQLLGTLTTVINSGTIQTQNITATPIPSGKIWGGLVQYNGAGQTVASGTYNNLTLSGSGSKKFATNIVINNITSIATSVTVDLNGINTHTTGALLLNGVNQIGGTWGTTTSGATNPNNTYFTGTGRIAVPNNTVIDSNFASYSNSTADVFASVGEYTSPLTLTAPNGFVFINTKFASYGTPNGTFPNFTIGSCHAVNSRAITTGLLGNTIATITTSNATFITDPCVNIVKRYSVVATYAEPICSGNSPGIITGSTPTGGNGNYTYLWEQSTSVTGPYASVPGINNTKDYTPGALSTTTYYRRTVNSGFYSDATIVIVPIISAPISAPTITSLCTNTTLSVPASTIPGTYVEWFSGSCASTIIATGTTYNPTAAGTYFARYTNRCGSSNCSSLTVSSTPPANTVSITPTNNPSPICTNAVNASLAYTATGSPNTYSIAWSPNGYLIDIVNRNLTGSPITLNIPDNVLAGTYTGTIWVRTSAGCVSSSKTFTIQIGKAAGIASSNSTLCQNTLMTPITRTTIGTTGIGTVSGFPSGVSASWASNTITISGTPTQSGTFNYTIPLTGSCPGSDNATGTIIVSPLPSTPTVATTVQPNCITPTGSVRLSGLPSGSWTLIRTGSSGLSINGTGLETTISGLAPGTYQFAVKSGSCTSSPTGNVVIDPVTTTTYTGSTWSVSPTIDMIGVINSNTPITANVQLCNCTVNTGINAVVSTGVSVILQDKLTVNGTLTFQNNASLIQINDVANIGNITYIRETTPIKRFDYTYWSSPVLGQKLIDVSPNTDPGSYYSFDPSTDNYFSENPQNQMKRGVGYIIRAPEGTAMPPTPLGSFIASFIGVPDNGPISVSAVVPNKPYLIGNPYPSAIDADAFLAANSKALFGTLYFWTHNTARGENVSNPGTGFYAYSADDYATYNTTGGVAVAKSDPNKAVTNPYRPTGKIAAGQAFFAGTLENMTSSTIVFNNRMRLGALNAILDNSQFFKIPSKKSNTASSFEKHRLWLNLTNTQGAFKQMLVGYITGATNSYDTTYDGVSYNGNRFVDFYSVNDNKKLTIQGRALPFEENDEIPLGYSSTIEGTFSISIDQVDGLLASRKIYLEDKIKNTTHNLNQGPYTFETAKGVFNERFVLRYTDKTLGVDDVDVKSNQVLVSVKNKVIKVDSGIESIDKIYVYTVSGTAIYEKQKVDALTFSISSLPVAQQVLIVKTVLQNGNVITNKIVY